MIPGQDFDIVNNKGLYYADWDVVDIMFRDWKPAQSHNLSVQGTSGRTNYFLSLGYNHEEGVFNFNPDKLNKYTANLNVTSDLTDWLQIGGRVNYSDKTFTTPYARRDVYMYLWRWGSFFGPYGTYEGNDFQNAIAYLKQGGEDKRHHSFTRLGAFIKAKITKGLTLNADYTFSVMNGTRNRASRPLYVLNSWGGTIDERSYVFSNSHVYQDSERDQAYALNIFANYEFSLAKTHNFNAMIGVNAEEGKYKSHWSQREGLLDPDQPEFNLAIGDQTVGGLHSEWGTAGWFGRINYDYKGIWLLELNGRYDGSSKFPENDRWAFFPSASIGYRISEENFFTGLKPIIPMAKIRASFGEIGNQAVGDHMYVSTLKKTADGSIYWLDANGNKVVAYDAPSLVSSSLKWERIQTLDIGADFGILNNDLMFSFDWYQRTTKDMLAPGKTLPDVLGSTTPLSNSGSLRTRGWEFAIDWRHRFNEFTLYASANIGDFKTVVTKWDNETKSLDQNYTGKVYGDIWGFVTDRYFTEDDFNADGSYKEGIASQKGLEQDKFVFGPGDIKFKDLDNSGFIDGGKGTADDHGDLKVIGNTTPRYQYGFRLGGEWKGIDIDMFFQGIGKRDVWTQSAFVMPMMRGSDALYANQTSYWSEDNPDPNADFPRMYPGNAGKGTISQLELGNHNFYPQSKYIVNMAYLRFKNLTVGYTLPKDWTRKAYMEKVRVYFSANNICEIINKSNAPVDPEINTSSGTQASLTNTNDYGNGTWGRVDPMYRTISFGLQVTF